MTRQAEAIASILQRECLAAGTTVLDCACGIVTQALGLAKLGFCITGSDVSSGAVQSARSEAAKRRLEIPFYVADMRSLDELPACGFHTVISVDNALPYLLSEVDLAQALGRIRAKMRMGPSLRASEIMTRSSLLASVSSGTRSRRGGVVPNTISPLSPLLPARIWKQRQAGFFPPMR